MSNIIGRKSVFTHYLLKKKQGLKIPGVIAKAMDILKKESDEKMAG